jgi:hypothetical protein
MTKFITTILLIVIHTGAFAQDSLFLHNRTIPGAVMDFNVDNLGNMYIVYGNGQLKKLNSRGDSVAVFNNMRRFGKLHSVDVTNPLKVLLFYKDFGTIVVLDRFLNERATIDLRRQNLLQVKAVGQAYDNNIWVFDEIESKLKRISDEGRIVDQSNDFRLIFDSAPSPQTIIDQDKYVYLYDTRYGVYTFDYYGAFKSRIPFTGWKDIRIINNSIVGRDENFLYRYEPGSLQLRKFAIPHRLTGAKKIIVSANFIFVLSDETLELYDVTMQTSRTID